MRQVIVKQWFEAEGGYGRVPRYSLHPDEHTCRSFASEHEDDRLKPEGKTFSAEVADDIYEQVEKGEDGVWYAGTVRMDGEDVDLSKKKD